MTTIVDGTTGITFPSTISGVSATQQYSGRVFQLITVYLDNVVTTTSSTSFVTTSWSGTITPTSATSKILVTVSGGSIYCQTTAGISYYATIYRGSTNIGNATYGLERFTTPGGSHSLAPHSMSVLDSPATTSATTYTPYFRNAGTAGQVDFCAADRGIVTMTLMEIAG
jgi:hypothetical protein